MKNRRTTIDIEEKLYVISRFKKVNELLTYGIMLDLLIVANVQYMIMLIVVQKVLSQDLNCCVASVPQSSGMNCMRNYGFLFQFYCIRNKYIIQKCMCTVYTVHMCCTGPYVH